MADVAFEVPVGVEAIGTAATSPGSSTPDAFQAAVERLLDASVAA